MAHSLGVHCTASYATPGKKKNLHRGCQTNCLLHNETGSRICFKRQLGLAGSKGFTGWKLVPKGRFPHRYFRGIRKPLKITYPPHPSSNGILSGPTSPCQHATLRAFNLTLAGFHFKKNTPRPTSHHAPGRAGGPVASALQHSDRIAGNSPACAPCTELLPCSHYLRWQQAPRKVDRKAVMCDCVG